MKLKNKILTAISLLKVKFLNKKIPVFVSWSLTNRCNLKCKYCSIYNKKSKELTTKQVFSIIDELAEMGTRAVSLIGGEALLRRDIGQIIRHLKNYGIYTILTSNGILVPDKINEIKNVDLLKLSLDGPEKVNDFIRNKGSYNFILKAIKKAKNKKIKLILNTTLTKYNLEYIDFLLKISKKFDVNVKFQPVNDICPSSKKNIKYLYPNTEEYKKAINKIIKIKENNGNIANSIDGLKYFYNWPEGKPLDCYAGKAICRINPNGDVYPCAIMEKKLKPINCVKMGFKNAFNNLTKVSCRNCWCSSTLEVNKLLSLNINSFFNLKKWL